MRLTCIECPLHRLMSGARCGADGLPAPPSKVCRHLVSGNDYY